MPSNLKKQAEVNVVKIRWARKFVLTESQVIHQASAISVQVGFAFSFSTAASASLAISAQNGVESKPTSKSKSAVRSWSRARLRQARLTIAEWIVLFVGGVSTCWNGLPADFFKRKSYHLYSQSHEFRRVGKSTSGTNSSSPSGKYSYS